jgi:hypothetical protein
MKNALTLFLGLLSLGLALALGLAGPAHASQVAGNAIGAVIKPTSQEIVAQRSEAAAKAATDASANAPVKAPAKKPAAKPAVSTR